MAKKTKQASPTPIVLRKHKIRLPELDLNLRAADKESYEKKLNKLQKKMLKIQQAYWQEGRRGIVVMQGWDAAGKGGAIRRITERLDPRSVQVWPISAPKPEEQGRHYLYRFWNKIPEKGHIGIFDRSWYGRVLVERVEGFCQPEEWQRAYQEINEFERQLTDDGVRIIKLFFHISPDEQLRRFHERLTNPVKRWKLTPEDLRNRQQWDVYQQAMHDMFDRTNTKTAPWHAVEGEHKWYARLRALELVIDHLGKDIDLSPPAPDPELLRLAHQQLGWTFKA
jgi:PPK2 family polyphosphate:nucleotide phosphotransferase